MWLFRASARAPRVWHTRVQLYVENREDFSRESLARRAAMLAHERHEVSPGLGIHHTQMRRGAFADADDSDSSSDGIAWDSD